MKQLVRFFFSPATFVNQLQWSRNHAMILLTFLGIAVVESQVGSGRLLNAQLSWLLAANSGLERDQALFLVQVARIAFFFFGALSLTETIWWIGSRLGHTTSKRVLQRRMAVVFTFMLGAYTVTAAVEPSLQWMAAVLFGWGLILAYLTVREQFGLDWFSASIVALIAVVGISLSWQMSDKAAKTAAGFAIAEQVAKSKPHHHRR